MDKPNTAQDVQKIVENELAALQEKYGKIPSSANLKIKVTETDASFKVYFKFDVAKSAKSYIGLAAVGQYGFDDYWFTWIKAEQIFKIIFYTEDSYLYITRQLK